MKLLPFLRERRGDGGPQNRGGLDLLLTCVKFRVPNRPHRGADPLGNQFHTIPVVDRNGDQLIVYEIVDRRAFFGLVTRKRLALCTGEPVEYLDRETFVIVGTGERLTRV